MPQNPFAMMGGQNPMMGNQRPTANPMVANIINQRAKRRKKTPKEGVVKAKGGRIPSGNISLQHPPTGAGKRVTRY